MKSRSKPSLFSAITLFVLLAAGQSGAAYGFDSDEHEMLGNAAIRVVAEEYGCFDSEMQKEKPQIKIAEQKQEICRALIKTLKDGTPSSDGELSSPSYGAVVANVDGFMTPEKLIAICSKSASGLPPEWPSSKCADKSTQYLQATHNNHTHFQHELLISLNTYHSLALSIAKEKHNLQGALFVNALADHYLHDFFAPGHITTPRSKLTDLFSNAMHDAANKIGASFHLRSGKGLDELKREMPEIQKIISSSANNTLVATFLSGDITCKPTDSDFKNDGVIELKGDGFLNRKEGCQQRLLMLAANVLSIKDVLNAYANGQVNSSFEPYEWSAPPKGFIPHIDAALPFGYYSLGPTATAEDDRDITARRNKYLPIMYENVWGVSIAKELFNANQHIARTSTSIETVPIGFIGDEFFANGGIAVGYYHYEGDGRVTGNGGSVRIGLIVPETETTLSFGVRRVYHAGTAQDGWRNGYNLRLDQGFTSFLSLYLSVGKDYAAPTGGMLAQGSYLSAGAMLALPSGRIANCLSNISHCLGK